MTFDDIVIGQENGRWYWFVKGSGEPPKPFTQVPSEVVVAIIEEVKRLRKLIKEVPDAQRRSEAPRKKARSAR